MNTPTENRTVWQRIDQWLQRYRHLIRLIVAICIIAGPIITAIYIPVKSDSHTPSPPESPSSSIQHADSLTARQMHEIWYRDSDGDNFGDPASPHIQGQSLSGYVQNSGDCYDSNPDAFPGQTNFFATDRGDGSFDYDCNGESQRELTQTGSCDNGTANEGWDGAVPAPGQTGAWLVDCDRKVQIFPPKIKIVRETKNRIQKGR